ncbi:hypothetical protein HF086_006291 [Spodoptera exigua]|uniref:Uncharacterized protein n=1 Tax=Spodoptera exigua TaxID=7107 RepID=A0A922S8Z0_SPOEX|nr:hypothetical protein HF086_006291 [Spodoptera exigua]
MKSVLCWILMSLGDRSQAEGVEAGEASEASEAGGAAGPSARGTRHAAQLAELDHELSKISLHYKHPPPKVTAPCMLLLYPINHDRDINNCHAVVINL